MAEAGAGPDLLVETYRELCGLGRFRAASVFLMGMSVDLAPSPDPVRPAPVPLADGPTEPVVVCLPSLGSVGPAEYLGLAAALGARRGVVAVPVPGSVGGGGAPVTRDALVDHLTDGVLDAADGRSFVLLGRSSGGVLAQLAAAGAARRGRPPSGVVLVDTYEQTVDAGADEWWVGLSATAVLALLDRVEPAVGAQVLRAFGAQLRLLRHWSPEPIAAPGLLVTAERPLPGMPERGWRATWSLPHAVATVPGDHVTMLAEHAAACAAVVEEWILSPASAGTARPSR